ncbi:globin domain-containing protein [Streptomyces sp. N2-109]|uniref:nitric oxide dioxygenase n=1 Tax=Streptomyces gossypii TaxID=2883101 RepID=A0ABT2JSQ1_9ACTN|nr:globin domain-containing protein [Streptomyces gossypii]MCT2590289.1 globin domain-containing protein [Streptomyces gossypii]
MPLSPKSTETVRATLPLVGASIGEIASRFYERMFAARPELLRDLFNRGNQANGNQQRALAGSIAQFAARLVGPPPDPHSHGTPDGGPALSRIAHKHASLGITPDQYEIVHEHLLPAIADTLGNACTAAVAEAWSEVYWLMADTLIEQERKLYAETGTSYGQVWRPYRVTGRIEETADVATFLAQPADGAQLPPALPGQYVSVRVELPDGAHQIRQYSLSGFPDDALRFTVKRVQGDRPGEVSHHLHTHLREGATVELSAPRGDLTLAPGDGPVLLASAGIGCTPMTGMLSRLAADASPRRVLVAHADRSPETHAFRADLEQFAAKLRNAHVALWYEHPASDGGRPSAARTGLMDLSVLDIPEGTTAYLCGPVGFMTAVRRQLTDAGVPAARIRYESFTPGPDL